MVFEFEGDRKEIVKVMLHADFFASQSCHSSSASIFIYPYVINYL